jgi:acyl carrier protein
MPIEDVYRELTSIVREIFDDDSLVATPELVADDVFGWDSFAQLRLILAVERTFGIDFAAAQITSLGNMGDLATLIQSKLK